MPSNPFLDQNFLPEWSRLQPSHVVPDITEGIARAQAAVDAIAQRSIETLDYENTFLALERSTEALTLAWAKVGHLQAVADATELREAYNAMLPAVTAFYAAIPLNAELWTRLRACAESPAVKGLTGVHRRFVDETLADFVQAGADLPLAERTRRQELQAALAQLRHENICRKAGMPTIPVRKGMDKNKLVMKANGDLIG